MIEFIYIVWFYIVWVKIEIVLKLVLLGLSFWYVGSDNDVISYVFVGEFCFCLCLVFVWFLCILIIILYKYVKYYVYVDR